MFKEFLIKYIQNLIECSTDEYELTEADIDDAASMVEANEYIWDIINEAIYQEIDKYIVESENKEENENE